MHCGFNFNDLPKLGNEMSILTIINILFDDVTLRYIHGMPFNEKKFIHYKSCNFHIKTLLVPNNSK